MGSVYYLSRKGRRLLAIPVDGGEPLAIHPEIAAKFGLESPNAAGAASLDWICMLAENSRKRSLDKAMELLTRRRHGQKELSGKLRRAGFDAATIVDTLAECERLGLVDDQAFAADYASELRSKGKGALRVRAALLAKGVDAETTSGILDETDGGDELGSATRLIQSRIRGWQREPDKFKRRAKAYRFLAYRGFTHETINAALRQTNIDSQGDINS